MIFSAAILRSFSRVRGRRPLAAARPLDSSAPRGADRGQYGASARGAARARIEVLAGVALLPLACVATPLPCRAPGACPSGSECLAQRCAPLGADPVPGGARGAARLVLEPADVVVLAPNAARAGGLPPTVAFGGEAGAGDTLLVRFGGAWRAQDVVAAFLLLEPAPGAEPSAEDVSLDVALASRAWSSRASVGSVSVRGPVGAALGRTRPADPLRVDVTAQLRDLGAAHGDEHGFLVRATGASARAAVYSTGARGLPPRLDLYLRQHPAPPRGGLVPEAAPRAKDK